MKLNQITGIFAGVLAILFLSGCITSNREEAAENAREYLLKNAEGLTVLQKNYIRYNDPVILNTTLWENVVPSAMPDAHIVARHERNVYKDPGRDMMIYCFGWRVPGMDKDIYVVGTAQRNYRFWEADRIVLRSRTKEDIAGMKIRKKAMLFAISAAPDMKGKIFHRVRYAPPAVHKTMFILDLKTKNENWKDYLNQVKVEEPVQISAIWIDPDTKKHLVVTGVADKANLDDWKPLKMSELTEEETKVYIGSKYTVYPDNTADPFLIQKEMLKGKAKEKAQK